MHKRNKKVNIKREKSLISFINPKSIISEQYRTIRTNIQFSSIDRAYRTIIITSAGFGEGKTTTTANLGVVMAQQGKKILIVDADLRKPMMHYTFKTENTIGLTNVLIQQTLLQEAIRKTDIEKLDILPSGPIPPNPAELLSSDAMKELMELALIEYDLVLFDSPPVNAVADTQILSNLGDGVVLVVNSGKTKKDTGTKALESLNSANAKLLGIVLNNKKQKGDQYYYNGSQ
ncbi:CpsD/CapB family tyrosine-protein kinase [Neobacillus drentensis]|uniref:CpsD/CapB family tyrosine-protein kinase n=1 Tax=Neobacillus drentensis TaxID=220684 RepID=UPI001F232F3A|nr:polysaccharide biosynthesis tyrosine autokinase [Neobacillus drentensis]ULT56213.1 CpsD/CapB family tyrosine-protein kinase [Neobacillus drentensis]